MPPIDLAKWYHANRYTADSECGDCKGVVRHENWCAKCNPTVAYAQEVVADASKLKLSDQLILHALGVAWIDSTR